LRFRPRPFNLAHSPRARAPLVVPARSFQPRSPSARPGSPHGPGPDHLNLAHPPCAWALHLQPRPGSGITPTRTCAAPTRPGPAVTMPLPSISGAHSPDSDADPSTNHDSPSRGPPPQGDWQVTGIGVRRQRPPRRLRHSRGVSCIRQRPLCAYSNGIQQPPFCRPTGGPAGFDPHGSSTPHLTYVAAGTRQPSHLSHGTRKRGQVRLAAGARSRGTVALELAPGQRGPLDNSEADRRRPTRAVQVDSDSTSKSYSNGFRHDRPTRTPTDFGLHRRCDLHKAPLNPQSDGEAVPGPHQ
jgi:hypothetical protein